MAEDPDPNISFTILLETYEGFPQFIRFRSVQKNQANSGTQ